MFKSHRRQAVYIPAMAVLALAVGSGLTVAPAAVADTAAAPAPPFSECPAIGASPGCEILLVVNADNTISVEGDPSGGPFDGSDDTLVGIINSSTKAVGAITVSGPGSDLSGFDGDGICSGDYGTWNGSAGCPYGPTGYEGPGTSFVTDPSLLDSAEVDFAGGLAPGAHAYFSLEGALTSAELTAREGPLECDFVYPPGTSAASGGKPDYCIPPDWNADTVAGAPETGEEPLNLIYSANSTVPFGTLLGDLRDWTQVSIGTDFLVGNCISAETAEVTGTARVDQAESWRLRGCIEGAVLLADIGQEDHARIWYQPVAGSVAGGAWFATASIEKTCSVEGRVLPYHCIVSNGYNRGVLEFAEDLLTVALRHHWKGDVRLDPRTVGTNGTGANSGAGTGLNKIRYSDDTYVLTVTSSS